MCLHCPLEDKDNFVIADMTFTPQTPSLPPTATFLESPKELFFLFVPFSRKETKYLVIDVIWEFKDMICFNSLSSHVISSGHRFKSAEFYQMSLRTRLVFECFLLSAAFLKEQRVKLFWTKVSEQNDLNSNSCIKNNQLFCNNYIHLLILQSIFVCILNIHRNMYKLLLIHKKMVNISRSYWDRKRSHLLSASGPHRVTGPL